MCDYVSILPSEGVTSPVRNIGVGGGQCSHLIWRFSSKNNTTSPTMPSTLPVMVRAAALKARLALGEKKQEANLVFDVCTGWNNVPVNFMFWYL